jgi:phosphoribosyl 1,2-cyclic phosphodiesterase
MVAVLASGSNGNCTWIGAGGHGLLVDAGISAKQVQVRLDAVGLPAVPIDAVLVTHEHRDHVQGSRVLSARLRARTGRAVPFYMTSGTARNLPAGMVPEAVESVGLEDVLRVGPFEVQPVPIPHDTADPVAWRIACDGVVAGVVTDLGRATVPVATLLRDLDVAVLEFNHDLDMLLEGRYPWPLKQRIRGNHGHLSNVQAADLLSSSLGPRLRHVVLAHLSEENNRPARALAAAHNALAGLGAAERVDVRVASRYEPTRPIRLPLHP